MFFSVVIPLYNKEQSVVKTLDCVLRQTYADYEVIIVNDGSTDGTHDILERYGTEYPEKIKVFHKENLDL